MIIWDIQLCWDKNQKIIKKNLAAVSSLGLGTSKTFDQKVIYKVCLRLTLIFQCWIEKYTNLARLQVNMKGFIQQRLLPQAYWLFQSLTCWKPCGENVIEVWQLSALLVSPRVSSQESRELISTDPVL